jgi:hypothetical protein
MHPLDSVWQSCVREFDLAYQKASRAARTETTNELNQIVRRLKNSESESELVDAVLDGTALFAAQVALFSLDAGNLRVLGARRIDLPPDLVLPLASVAAFANSVESKDTVVTMRTPAEVSETLSTGDKPQRAFLMPTLNRNRVAAVLFASADDHTDLNGLELLSAFSSAMLERIRRKAAVSQNAQGEDPEASGTRAKLSLPSWSDLDEAQRSLHIRAQRFARTKVAEMQLYKPELCQKGNDRQDVYLYLKQEIDSAREGFRTQFMTIPTMVDYLHLELVSSLVHGDEFLLGADYPGQMQ